jgi:hypothetical protein
LLIINHPNRLELIWCPSNMLCYICAKQLWASISSVCNRVLFLDFLSNRATGVVFKGGRQK